MTNRDVTDLLTCTDSHAHIYSWSYALAPQDFLEAEIDIKHGLMVDPENTDLVALSKKLKVRVHRKMAWCTLHYSHLMRCAVYGRRMGREEVCCWSC